MKRGRGVTLLELMVTIAVIGVLMAVAIPSYRQMVISNRLTTTTNGLIGALSQARLEAVRRNATTQFCSNVAATNGAGTLATACGTAAGAIFVLNSDGSTSQLHDAATMPVGVSLSTSGSGVIALQYGGQGLARRPATTAPYTGLVADIRSTQISQNNQRCIYMAAGSVISTCVMTSNGGGCPANEPANCQGQ